MLRQDGANRTWRLTVLEDIVELCRRDDCEAVGNDRVGVVVAVVVDEDFAGGRHVGVIGFARED